jgi:hypothetical protein
MIVRRAAFNAMVPTASRIGPASARTSQSGLPGGDAGI